MNITRAYYIKDNKCVEIKGFDLLYKTVKMMCFAKGIAVVCIGVGCSPIQACIGYSIIKSVW